MSSKLWRSLVVIIFASFPLSFSFAAGPQSSPEDKWQYTNHLIKEKSPYLLQHAHNPVEWFPCRCSQRAHNRRHAKTLRSSSARAAPKTPLKPGAQPVKRLTKPTGAKRSRG